MSTSPTIFERAHADAQKAVATFLPSLSGRAPQPPPSKPHPLAKADIMHDMTHAAALARHVEQASANIVQGKPANPQPPSPEQSFGNVLDIVHTRAIQNAIAAHPEEQRSRLISEAHDSVTQWIASHNGKVIVHGKVMTAKGLPEAERLAAKIVNDTVEEHDQRKQAEAEALANPSLSDKRGTASGADAGRGTPASASVPTDQPTADVSGADESGASTTESGGGDAGASTTVGKIDPATGRTITHSTSDLDQAQAIATEAAPELKDTLSQVADSIHGVKVHGIRESKDPERAQRKAEADDKPVHTHSDLLAGRLAVDSPQAKDAAVAALKSTTPVIDEEDKFNQGDPEYGYRTHNLQVALGNGKTSAEVQIVPKEIADADEETHPTYEAGREAEAQGDTEAAEQAKAENKAAHDAAMGEFNARNSSLLGQAGKTDEQHTASANKAARLRQLLAEAGFELTGDPVSLGGHSFLPIRDGKG